MSFPALTAYHDLVLSPLQSSGYKLTCAFCLIILFQIHAMSTIKFFRYMTPHHWVLHCESLTFGTCNVRSFIQAKPHASQPCRRTSKTVTYRCIDNLNCTESLCNSLITTPCRHMHKWCCTPCIKFWH